LDQHSILHKPTLGLQKLTTIYQICLANTSSNELQHQSTVIKQKTNIICVQKLITINQLCIFNFKKTF